MDVFNYIFKVVVAPELQRALLPIKVVVFIISFILIFFIIYFFIITSYKDYLFLERWRDLQNWKRVQKNKIKQFKEKRKHQINLLRQEKDTNSKLEENNEDDKDNLEKSAIKESSNEFKEKEKMNKWERVTEKLKSNNELNYKLAFIDADKIFNETLEQKNETLSSETISNSKEIIKAKEVLEKMLSHPEAKLTLERAKELVAIYEKALLELKAI